MTGPMRSTNRDRQREIREARLLQIQQQLSTGALVIRQITSEHEVHAGEREKRHASMAPAERARGEAILPRRSSRAAFFGSATDAGPQ